MANKLSRKWGHTAEEANSPYTSIWYCIDPWKIARRPMANGRPLRRVCSAVSFCNQAHSDKEGDDVAGYTPHHREPYAELGG